MDQEILCKLMKSSEPFEENFRCTIEVYKRLIGIRKILTHTNYGSQLPTWVQNFPINTAQVCINLCNRCGKILDMRTIINNY